MQQRPVPGIKYNLFPRLFQTKKKDRLASKQKQFQQKNRVYLGQVAVNLVAIEVGVVGVAVGVVHADRLVPRVAEDADPVRHDPGLVQGGLPVDQHAVGIIQVSPHLPYPNTHTQQKNIKHSKIYQRPVESQMLFCLLYAQKTEHVRKPYFKYNSGNKRHHAQHNVDKQMTIKLRCLRG